LHSSIDKMKEQDFYDLSIEYLVKLTDRNLWKIIEIFKNFLMNRVVKE
jgi:hypothetical protein